MKFVAYYRVSTQKQDYGIEAQRETVSRYLKTLPQEPEVLREVEERESGANNDRVKLKEALDLAQKEGARLVIAKLDRLSRDASFLLTLQRSGVDFVCCDLPSADKFTIGILALVAQRERELISERTKAGLAIAKAKGVRLGPPKDKAREGWNKAAQSIQERKKAFAKQAYKSIVDIKSTGITSLYKISQCLNKRGEKTARGGKAWTPTAVKRVLQIVNT